MKPNILLRIPGWILMVVAFMYIRKMAGCECADQEIVKKLHYFEMYFIGLSALVFGMSLSGVSVEKWAVKNTSRYATVISMGFAAYFSALAYFVYLVYEFYLGVDQCKCADDPMKYALYVQGGAYAISISILALIFTIGFYAGVSRSIKNR